MKKAKLRQLLADGQKAHKASSAALKIFSQKSNEVKIVLKERKRELSVARKQYKLARKVHREINEKLKETRKKHSENNKHLKKLSKKWAKANGGTKATSAVQKQKRVRVARNKVNHRKIAEPALSILS